MKLAKDDKYEDQEIPEIFIKQYWSEKKRREGEEKKL